MSPWDPGIVLPYLLWGVLAYLLGSTSLGDMVARVARFPNRNVGTSNPGTANVFREMDAGYPALVLGLLKGSASMLPEFVFDVDYWAGTVGGAGVLLAIIYRSSGNLGAGQEWWLRLACASA